MSIVYSNVGAALSEVTRTLAAQDWTAHGVRVLHLWFSGDSAYTLGQLYAGRDCKVLERLAEIKHKYMVGRRILAFSNVKNLWYHY